jgi:hypothetical protein
MEGALRIVLGDALLLNRQHFHPSERAAAGGFFRTGTVRYELPGYH